MLALEAYESLPEAEKYVGQGRFGSVKKVKRVSDSKVSIPYSSPPQPLKCLPCASGEV